MEKLNGISEYNLFIQSHGSQLQMSGVPVWFWHTLFTKLKSDNYDANDSFMIDQFEDGSLGIRMSREEGMLCNDASHIYMVEHTWTFQLPEASRELRDIEGLLPRMRAMLGLLGNEIVTEIDSDDAIVEVYNKMWKHLRTFSCPQGSHNPPATFWYILDEFGSAIRHSDSPNFRAVPFFYRTQYVNTVTTLLFPIKNLEFYDEVNIDVIEGTGNEKSKTREALLVPWTKKSFINESIDQVEPNDDYFMSGTKKESLPEPSRYTISSPATMKVYVQYSFIRRYLTSPDFVLTDDEEEADILWFTRHFYNYKELAESRRNTFVNQFPCERVITTKDLLSIVARRAGKFPKWLPLTYNLMTELPEFVSIFQRREAAGLDNHWICKPWNLARAIDTTVSNNLDCILRLPFSGPKIAQKYVENPILFNILDVGNVKFDIRYVVLLKSVEPLELFCYKKFFLRFANKAFELDDLWDYEKHFTVMNYRSESRLYRLLCEDFVVEFEKQYPSHSWQSVENKILNSLKEVFLAASSQGPPRGLGPSPQSRALYAADYMLAWDNQDIQPLLLEINFTPDCERACLYYPDFYNDIFALLFKNVQDLNKFHSV